MATRKASHAGSWYVSDGRQLRAELDHWLRAVETGPAPRAIIVPHAGYRYSGACAAHAYRQVDPTRVRRVFVLGPSHHVRLSGCAVSACRTLATPLYDLNVDTEITKELLATGEFETMTLEADEDEHSIEMHLPYLARHVILLPSFRNATSRYYLFRLG
jgi:AmmeMemoRadiSam system protein B